MTGSRTTVTLTRVRATSYRCGGEVRFLIELTASTPAGARLRGMAECRPPGRWRYREWPPGTWDTLTVCLGHLEGRVLHWPDADAAGGSIRSLLAELAQVPEVADTVAVPERPEPEERTSRPGLTGAVRTMPLKKVVAKAAHRGLRMIVNGPGTVAPGKRLPAALAGVERALVDLAVNALGVAPTGLDSPTDPGRRPDDGEVYARVLHGRPGYVSFPPPAPVTYRGRRANTYDEVAYLAPLGADGAKGSVLEREALMWGLSTTRYSKGAFLATDGVGTPLCFRWSRSPLSSAVSLGLCTHKEATRLRLQQTGVPVPRGRTFANGDWASAEAYADLVGYPVVVKPAAGVRGIGVVANIRGPEELRRAFRQFELSRFGDGEFIVEEHIPGRDYRIVVVGDRVIAAVLREPASVEGDGEHTIGQLIVNKNAVRALNPHLLSRLIKYGDAARHQLDRAGLTLASVPAPGQRVVLSDSCSLSQGGDSIDVLDELHPSIKDACVRAVRAIPGMWYCGVDFLLEDHTGPLDEQRAGICELNAHAAISNCQYPLYGTPRDVAGAFFEQCVRRFGLLTNDKRAERLALRLTIRGRVTGVGYRVWMQRRAEAFGVAGWVRNVDARTVEAVVIGDAVPVSALVAGAIRGPRRASPVSVTTEHIDPLPLEHFEIREDGPRRDGEPRRDGDDITERNHAR